jgi:hypothetical protein
MARIAMWSGPRNISTAMMRSFGARDDTVVVDEPLYAHYLAATGLQHPGRDRILASQPVRWQQAVGELLAALPAGRPVQYQKQMTHHLLTQIGDAWMGSLSHAFLIRDPAEVIASYAKVREEPTLADLGFEPQAGIFRRFGGPVVDAADLLRDPAGMLSALCAALGIEYQPAMLSWPAGPRDTDGVWAPHWYASVESSTGFAAPRKSQAGVPDRLKPLVEAARPYYLELAAHRIRPAARQ